MKAKNLMFVICALALSVAHAEKALDGRSLAVSGAALSLGLPVLPVDLSNQTDRQQAEHESWQKRQGIPIKNPPLKTFSDE